MSNLYWAWPNINHDWHVSQSSLARKPEFLTLLLFSAALFPFSELSSSAPYSKAVSAICPGEALETSPPAVNWQISIGSRGEDGLDRADSVANDRVARCGAQHVPLEVISSSNVTPWLLK